MTSSTTTPPVRSISYGGGVQSTALIVLAAQGVIDYPLALFSNVGEQSEHPATLAYVRDVAAPWAAAHGIEVVELQRRTRDGRTEDLYDRLMRPGSRSLPIPVRMAGGAPGTRACTADFKIRVISKELKARGATIDRPATVAVGISTDEIERMNSRRDEPTETIVYPLIDLRLSRADCMRIIADAGLPVPPKSACYFCPFHRPQVWAEMRRDEPELFEKSALLEDTLNARRAAISCHTEGVPAVDVERRWRFFATNDDDAEVYSDYPGGVGDPELGEWEQIGRCPDCNRRDPLALLPGDLVPAHPKDSVYLTRFGRPLRDAIPEAQAALFAVDSMADLGGPDALEGCDSGYCMT